MSFFFFKDSKEQGKPENKFPAGVHANLRKLFPCHGVKGVDKNTTEYPKFLNIEELVILPMPNDLIYKSAAQTYENEQKIWTSLMESKIPKPFLAKFINPH